MRYLIERAKQQYFAEKQNPSPVVEVTEDELRQKVSEDRAARGSTDTLDTVKIVQILRSEVIVGGVRYRLRD